MFNNDVESLSIYSNRENIINNTKELAMMSQFLFFFSSMTIACIQRLYSKREKSTFFKVYLHLISRLFLLLDLESESNNVLIEGEREEVFEYS